MAAQRVAGLAGAAGEKVQREAQQLLRDILAQVGVGARREVRLYVWLVGLAPACVTVWGAWQPHTDSAANMQQQQSFIFVTFCGILWHFLRLLESPEPFNPESYIL
eukprot:364328-Chlamydomonas_euryale.AAC.13